MTILVLDQFRISADTYAEVTDGDHVYTDGDYRKIFPITPIWVRSLEVGEHKVLSWGCMGFVGDAVAFMPFLEAYREAKENNQEPEESYAFRDLLSKHGKGRCRVIVPYEGGAVEFTKVDAEVTMLRLYGETLVFGGSHVEDSAVTNKAWFMVYLDAYRAKKLPGLEVDSLMYGTKEVQRETILDDAAAKEHRRKRRCHPFRRLRRAF